MYARDLEDLSMHAHVHICVDAQAPGASERVADTCLRDGLRRGGCFRPRLTSPDH